MASDARIAKLLSHIAACHTAVLPGTRLPLYAGAHHIGYVRPALAARLAEISPRVTVLEHKALLNEAALPQLNELAAAAGVPTRSEDFDVREEGEGPVLAVLDRGALPSFGVIGVGVHLNGIVRRADGVHLWVGKRAANKKLDPGKLDHLVAGGVPAGYTPFEALVKEAEEEAALPEALAVQARHVASFRYDMERPEGLRRDLIHAYDLELPEDFTPEPVDGEVESFSLWPLPRVLEVLATTDEFKFNVALVLTDLLIREGLITGEAAETLRTALHP
ncbi:NUDIX hydrolase [Acidocella aromatica]|uniref:8-oxo-dGTP pyrophosphatase MutT (NUDIX family) n=1 Tax=Acidocella aromatica TaxID=1303579 RepID=A0A840VLR0_9PROT|nr:NUDIX domain-containing protein [Acidocella aromatica]MBB5373129.1 8-oxo-dGTP pyrophosphatase MutT (NUDIX family) [Acidocella aromatica]